MKKQIFGCWWHVSRINFIDIFDATASYMQNPPLFIEEKHFKALLSVDHFHFNEMQTMIREPAISQLEYHRRSCIFWISPLIVYRFGKTMIYIKVPLNKWSRGATFLHVDIFTLHDCLPSK